MTPWLSHAEINDICHPLTQKAAQRGYLQSLGLNVKPRPDGSPIVMRSNAEAVLGSIPCPAARAAASPIKTEPNRAGLTLMFSKKSG